MTDEGYPNIALYDASGEHHGRVIGFGGRDEWFRDLKVETDRGDAIREARAKAAADPAANVDLGKLLAQVPGREQDALDAYGKVPLEKADAAVAAAMAALKARVAWRKFKKAYNDRYVAYLEGIDPKDIAAGKAAVAKAYRELAPKVKEEIDAFLAEFPTSEEATNALLQKARVLLQSDLVQEGLATARQFLEKYPDHRAAKGLKTMIEQAEKDLAKKPGDPGK